MNQENGERKIKRNLKSFLKNLKRIEEYYNLLPEIVEWYLHNNDKSNIISDLRIHITETFQIDASALFDYLVYNKKFEDLGNDEYKKPLECVNKIKMQYGPILRKYVNGNRNPFLINGIETNIDNNSTVHHMKFIRSDGEELKGQFRPDILLNLSLGIINSLKQSMDKGIYNIPEEIVDNYLKKSKDFNVFLNKIKEESQEESNGLSDGKNPLSTN